MNRDRFILNRQAKEPQKSLHADNQPPSESSELDELMKLPAWQEAAANGADLSLLLSNLKKTPTERLCAHEEAMDLVEELEQASQIERNKDN